MALILVSFAQGSWSTWGGDNANTGQQTLRGAMAEAPTVKWGLAWANSIEWQFSAISDADGDGKLDVLLASPALYLYALNGPDGSQLWAFQAISGFSTPPSVADLNGDGVPEVVVGSFDSLVYCLHGPSGSLRWKFNLATDPHSPFSGDVDGDGCSEVVVGTNGSDTAERFLFVLDDRDGATQFTWRWPGRGAELSLQS